MTSYVPWSSGFSPVWDWSCNPSANSSDSYDGSASSTCCNPVCTPRKNEKQSLVLSHVKSCTFCKYLKLRLHHTHDYTGITDSSKTKCYLLSVYFWQFLVILHQVTVFKLDNFRTGGIWSIQGAYWWCRPWTKPQKCVGPHLSAKTLHNFVRFSIGVQSWHSISKHCTRIYPYL